MHGVRHIPGALVGVVNSLISACKENRATLFQGPLGGDCARGLAEMPAFADLLSLLLSLTAAREGWNLTTFWLRPKLLERGSPFLQGLQKGFGVGKGSSS